METRSELGLRLAETRKRKGLTQEDLAALLGRSVDALSNIERGKSYPSFEMVGALAKALDLDLHELFDAEPTRGGKQRKLLLAQLMAISRGLDHRNLQLAVEQLEAIARRG